MLRDRSRRLGMLVVDLAEALVGAVVAPSLMTLMMMHNSTKRSKRNKSLRKIS